MKTQALSRLAAGPAMIAAGVTRLVTWWNHFARR
jgi:hypothetical protein